MRISIHSSFGSVHIITILRLLISTVFIISQNTIAQTDITNNDSVVIVETQTVNAGKYDNHRKIEVGTGGKIKTKKTHRTEVESQFDWHTHLLWESRYVSEGRDNLSGDNIISLSSDFIFDKLTFVPWVAYSAGADYSELNLNVVYSTSLTKELTASLGYNHIRSRYHGEGAWDNEISLDLDHKLLNQLAVFASIYHSFDANGSFTDIGTRYEYTQSKKVHYHVEASLGANAGYISDGHNGLNHFQIRADASYLPMMQIEFYTYVGYNNAINRDATQYAGDELLEDFFWGGIGLNYLF